MLVAGTEEDGDLWFITDASSGKVGEILRDDRAAVVMQGGGRYLSISGRSELVPDPDRLTRLWSPRYEPWFEGGVADPKAVLIRFHGETAEYWDRSGVKGIALAIDLLAASMPGRAMDQDPDERRHAKVELDR